MSISGLVRVSCLIVICFIRLFQIIFANNTLLTVLLLLEIINIVLILLVVLYIKRMTDYMLLPITLFILRISTLEAFFFFFVITYDQLNA
jgi:hypothetical protein